MPVVTVIPSDKLIVVDGDGLYFDFTAPDNMHALQWDGTKGHIEYVNCAKPNKALGQSAYKKEVAPYVVLWEAEKERLAELDALRIAEYNSYDAQCARIRSERDSRLQVCDKMNPMRWQSLTDAQQNAWREYRQALLDITDKEGFPWDGDVEKAPWPEEVK